MNYLQIYRLNYILFGIMMILSIVTEIIFSKVVDDYLNY